MYPNKATIKKRLKMLNMQEEDATDKYIRLQKHIRAISKEKRFLYWLLDNPTGTVDVEKSL